MNYEIHNYSNKAGISASSLSFSGVTYQYSFSENWRISGVGFLYLTEDSDQNQKELEYSFGMQIQRTIIRDNRWSIFLIMGGGLFIDENERNVFSSEYINGVYTPKTEVKRDNGTNFTAGLGIGASYQISKYIAVDVEVGYKFDSDKTTTKNLTDITEPDNIKSIKSVIPFVGIGAYICF